MTTRPRHHLRNMKVGMKRGLRAVVSLLPRGAQLAMLEQVCADLGPWTVMARVAPRCSVSSLRVAGAYGTFQGASTDTVILAEYARTGQWAKRTNDLLREFFSGRGGRYVDVGANIGLTTIPVARNSRVRCLSLEPDPTNFANLEVNVSTNCQHGNVQTRQLAVFSHRARLQLELAPENLGDHRLRLSDEPGWYGEEDWPTVEVEAVALDEVVAPEPGLLAVKIDTQGAEPFVFAGGSRTLSAADLIIAEWAPYQLGRLGGDLSSITALLLQSASQVSIAEGEDCPIPPPEPAAVAVERLLEMARRYRDDPLKYVDIIATK